MPDLDQFMVVMRFGKEYPWLTSWLLASTVTEVHVLFSLHNPVVWHTCVTPSLPVLPVMPHPTPETDWVCLVMLSCIYPKKFAWMCVCVSMLLVCGYGACSWGAQTAAAAALSLAVGRGADVLSDLTLAVHALPPSQLQARGKNLFSMSVTIPLPVLL